MISKAKQTASYFKTSAKTICFCYLNFSCRFPVFQTSNLTGIFELPLLQTQVLFLYHRVQRFYAGSKAFIPDKTFLIRIHFFTTNPKFYHGFEVFNADPKLSLRSPDPTILGLMYVTTPGLRTNE